MAWNDAVSPRSNPGSSVVRYKTNAVIPTRAAATRTRRRMMLSASALGGNERLDVGEPTRGEEILTFQRAGFWRGLARGVFGLSRQIGRQPLADSAFQRD